MSELEVEFLSLETHLLSDPENLQKLVKMVRNCMELSKLPLAIQFLRRCMSVYSKEPTTAGEGMILVDLALKLWKSTKYTATDTLRINITSERARLLNDTHKMLELLRSMEDPALDQIIRFKLACVKEHSGQLQEAIAILSELISIQAMDGVDLTYIILKAAVILKHLGNHDQAIEYLEFLLDDPPVKEGYGKTHVLAFLALVYDQHPKRQDFVVVLRNTYEELLQSYSQDLSKGNRPMTNQKKIEKMLGGKGISQSSEVWEMLSLQAVDRCEYVFAFELMQQAVDKAPGKYKLLHLMAEVSYLLSYKDRSIHYAEQAFELQPQSTDLRTMLLLINPKKWQDKLRNHAPSKSHTKKLDGGGTMKLQRVDGDEEEEKSWTQKLKEGGVSALFTSNVTPEEKARKAKVAEAKAARKEQKAERKKKKDALKAEQEANKASKRPGAPRKKRDPMVDGPARPEKPLVTVETKRLLDIAREGQGHIHWYDMTLRKFSEARGPIQRAERQWLAQQRAVREQEEEEADV